MTLRTGEKHKFQTLGGFMNDLDVTGEEILLVAPEEEKEEMVEFFNDNRGDWDEDKVDSVEDFPDWVYEEFQEWWDAYLRDYVEYVLYDRDEEYVWIDWGDVDVIHIVIELEPIEAEQ